MFHSSELVISKPALKNNFQFVRSYLGYDVKIAAVIKANAYGHGIQSFVPVAEEAGISHFAVFSADEALEACKIYHPDSSLMIMGYIDNEELAWAIENEIEFYVFDMDRLEQTVLQAKQQKKPAKIHVELETGMHRTGFLHHELKPLTQIILENQEFLEIKGLCTHYAGAESIANHVRVNKQINTFLRKYRWLVSQGVKPEVCHTACSAASMVYPKSRMDMVRVGILHYGFWPSIETRIHYISKTRVENDPLIRAISWRSRVMSVQEVKTGEFVGYGTSYLVQNDSRIAIVPVGYCNGYSRSLSNHGRVLIRGQFGYVIGMVNMNMLMVDVTQIPGVDKGDEVMLIGKQDENEIEVSSFGAFSDQLNYETLARLPLDIPRRVSETGE